MTITITTPSSVYFSSTPTPTSTTTTVFVSALSTPTTIASSSNESDTSETENEWDDTDYDQESDNNDNESNDGNDTSYDSNSYESDNNQQDENSSDTSTVTGTGTEPGVMASPTEESILNPTNNNNVPGDVFSTSDPSVPSHVSNKALGIGLGVGIGCIAALGLAGLLVHNRKKQTQVIDNTSGAQVPTRWRPQSFMGVVASVVSKLPRSPSQRSKASGDMLSSSGGGVAVGYGEGAVESQRQY